MSKKSRRLQGGSMQLGLEPTLEQKLDLALQLKWNTKLLREFPFGPVDLQRMGLVTKKNYTQQSRKIGEFMVGHINNRAYHVAQVLGSRVTQKSVLVTGCGEMREWKSIPYINELGMDVEGVDVSTVAELNMDHYIAVVRRYFAIKSRTALEPMLGARAINKVTLNEIMEYTIGQEVALVVAGQFVQILPAVAMQMLMQSWGRVLAENDEREILMFHPQPEDNNQPVQWEGIELPNAEFGDSTPYAISAMLPWLRRGARRPVQAQVLGKGNFYHQVYSAILLSLK